MILWVRSAALAPPGGVLGDAITAAATLVGAVLVTTILDVTTTGEATVLVALDVACCELAEDEEPLDIRCNRCAIASCISGVNNPFFSFAARSALSRSAFSLSDRFDATSDGSTAFSISIPHSFNNAVCFGFLTRGFVMTDFVDMDFFVGRDLRMS